ncbi:Endonuclease/Exonuclease/phosphatase family protein [Loktanella fryxellensis]|uniref:Endonuclease/Exonuclease/phosphatase family protein n=1 Tax=Loktanella fryxellensis TaxID=245187 RepID=A0A1H8E954_9RHOB|nr:endonuclease/exonuclease/phosphatase family protein [Loktanella fryxellensis]SEN15308.1 Endonuclease/Exonuclease/phosphatase family protein [Loktanella fryxellensis]
MRIATFAAPLGRDGPGLMLRDLGRADVQIDAVVAIVAQVNPDILLLTDVDFDADGLALDALADRMGFAHAFALRPNTGMATGLDLDGNGYLGDARDAQGYGTFNGAGGMALLSRWPVQTDAVRDLSSLLWRDMAGATLPEGPLWTEDIAATQRLSTTGHWIVPVAAPNGPVTIMAFSATPPVFDGPEDRNGLRNADEVRLWAQVLDGLHGPAPQDAVIVGNANLDPADGDGLRDVMVGFLSDPRLTDPEPRSAGGMAAADADHAGNPALDTADWPDGAPGNLRVSYVMPTAGFTVTDSGVFWPAPDDPDAAMANAAGPHRLVWVDLSR